jgi:hypothetical protein
MMIDADNENLIPLFKSPRHIPGRPHISTVYRWADRPVNPLETIRVGGRRFTSREAISRFIAYCSGEKPERPCATRRAERAAAELREMGIR